ncbi:MAG: hypothetical protein AAFV69_00920 [Pseudomonadota bacterium]
MDRENEYGARRGGAPYGRRGVRPASQPMQPARLAAVTNPAACNDNTGILHLAELVPIVRQRLGVAVEFPDELILSSLKSIADETTDRDRWRVAFESRLGLWLSTQGRELGRALMTLVSLLPPPRS